MKISVIGCGYLGAVHAATLASMGHTVAGIDVDPAKVDQLGRGQAPFFEPGLDELLRDGRATGRLTFSTDFAAAAGAQVHFLCVGTPQSKTSDGADLTFLVAATEALLPHLARGAVVVGKSTVPVGTVDMLREVLAGRPDVQLGWNPEFLRQGTAVKDTLVPDRLVYGVEGGRAAAFNSKTMPWAVTAALDAVYEPLLNAGIPRLVCNFATAELIKSAANAYLATKVSFINAIAELCDASGADVAELARRWAWTRGSATATCMPGWASAAGACPRTSAASGTRPLHWGWAPWMTGWAWWTRSTSFSGPGPCPWPRSCAAARFPAVPSRFLGPPSNRRPMTSGTPPRWTSPPGWQPPART